MNIIALYLKTYYNTYVRFLVPKPFPMETITVSKARANLYQLFKQTLKKHLPLRINSKEGTLVLLPEEDFDNLMETAELLSINGFQDSIKKGDSEIKKGELYTFDNVLKKKKNSPYFSPSKLKKI